jgi:hypothetical protein
MLLEKGNVFIEELFLQRLVSGADNPHLARSHEWDKVRETFPNPCGSFQEGVRLCG